MLDLRSVEELINSLDMKLFPIQSSCPSIMTSRFIPLKRHQQISLILQSLHFLSSSSYILSLRSFLKVYTGAICLYGRNHSYSFPEYVVSS